MSYQCKIHIATCGGAEKEQELIAKLPSFSSLFFYKTKGGWDMALVKSWLITADIKFSSSGIKRGKHTCV